MCDQGAVSPGLGRDVPVNEGGKLGFQEQGKFRASTPTQHHTDQAMGLSGLSSCQALWEHNSDHKSNSKKVN